MMSIIIGLFLISLGIWGVFDEWYYVVDFLKGAIIVVLLVIGPIGLLSGISKPRIASDEAGGLPE